MSSNSAAAGTATNTEVRHRSGGRLGLAPRRCELRLRDGDLRVSEHLPGESRWYSAPRPQLIHVLASQSGTGVPRVASVRAVLVWPQVHGFPRMMGVLTHLDSFRNVATLRRVKKQLKHREYFVGFHVAASTHHPREARGTTESSEQNRSSAVCERHVCEACVVSEQASGQTSTRAVSCSTCRGSSTDATLRWGRRAESSCVNI